MPAVTWGLGFYGLIRWTAPCITGAKPVSGPNCHTVRTRNGLISPCALYDKPLYDNKGYWRPILIWLPLETIVDGCLFSWEWQGLGKMFRLKLCSDPSSCNTSSQNMGLIRKLSRDERENRWESPVGYRRCVQYYSSTGNLLLSAAYEFLLSLIV